MYTLRKFDISFNQILNVERQLGVLLDVKLTKVVFACHTLIQRTRSFANIWQNFLASIYNLPTDLLETATYQLLLSV